MSDGRGIGKDWTAGNQQWPEQTGCYPLVGRPYSVGDKHHRNVAACNTQEQAYLIAAAPDLQEAAQEAFGFLGRVDGASDVRVKLLDALLKARGRL